MREIEIDPVRRIARVDAGVVWQEVLEQTQPHGLTALAGSAHDVGVAGYSDLFWAVRGGGGSFGVVTALGFRLYPYATVVGGAVAWDWSHAGPVLHRWAQIHGDPPEPVPYASDHAMLGSLPPEAVDAFVAAAGPGSGSTLLAAELRQLGGAMARTPAEHGVLPDPPGRQRAVRRRHGLRPGDGLARRWPRPGR